MKIITKKYAMIGYEIEFLSNYDNDIALALDQEHVVDAEGPFFSLNKIYKFKYLELKSWILSGNSIRICKNEYLGNKNDYDFNNCFSRQMISNVKELREYLNN